MIRKAVFIFIAVVFSSLYAADTQVTIYNQDFAIIKEKRLFDLKSGENVITINDIASHIEAESVIVRDINNPNSIKILEQNFEEDPLSQNMLLLKNEGKIVSFKVLDPETKGEKIVKAKIIRSGYVPHTKAYSRYSSQYVYAQSSFNYSEGNTPIIEMDGKIFFSLPGQPIFDSIEVDSFLKPSLFWILWSKDSGKKDLEFSYITGGMRWEATYNVIFPQDDSKMDLIGWVTLDNQSGKRYDSAVVKLMAGDVNKIKGQQSGEMGNDFKQVMYFSGENENSKQAKERSFDEYHLYDLKRPLTLRDRETKQVEFLRAAKVNVKRSYIYDGVKFGERYSYFNINNARNDGVIGTECYTKIRTMVEVKNSEENNLGMPLPKGMIKIYKRDLDGRNEFIGEDNVAHTSKNETLEIFLGNAFDIAGERKQTSFKIDNGKECLDESIEIKIRNHKKEAITVIVVEHMYRWTNWEISSSSDSYTKTDSKTIEFAVKVKPEEEKKVTYLVHYSW